MRIPTLLLATVFFLASTAAQAGVGGAKSGLIAFCSNRSGQWRIWTVHPDGTNLKQLSKAGEGDHDVDPVFSPDGRSILFTSTRGGKAGVWRMGADGSKPKRICDGDQGEWSPDGKKIVFRRAGRIVVRRLSGDAVQGPGAAVTPGRSGPATREDDSRTPVRRPLITKDKAISPKDWSHCSGPSWSPDGKSIALAVRRDGHNAVFILPAGGGKGTKVYDKKGACEPHWSPDGKTIVYETEIHICTIRPDGTGNRLVTWFGGVQRYGRFSPDGKHIVFCQGASERGPWELYIIPAGGGTPRKLTERGSDMHPDWAGPPRAGKTRPKPAGAAK